MLLAQGSFQIDAWIQALIGIRMEELFNNGSGAQRIPLRQWPVRPPPHACRGVQRAFQQLNTFAHRCWALFGLGRLEAALEAANEASRLHPTARYTMMTRTVLLQALGRTAEAQDMLCKTRRSAPAEPLDFWVGLVRGSYMSETMFRSYSQHFIDVWNATPEEKAHNQLCDGSEVEMET